MAGFDEVIDFRALEGIDVISEGLSRVCEAFREMDAASSRPITIFYRPENAFNWRDDRPAPRSLWGAVPTVMVRIDHAVYRKHPLPS